MERPRAAARGRSDTRARISFGDGKSAATIGQPAPAVQCSRDYRDDAALRPQPKRQGPDFWATPLCLIDAMISYVLPELPPGIIWECASGDGCLASAMRNAGRQVIASDLYRDGVDFLRDDPLSLGRFAAICTNPPFNLLDEFIDRGLQLIDNGVAQSLVLLLRHDHLQAECRVSTLNRAALMLGCNWRARWIPNSTGQPRWTYTWVLWRAGHLGPPISVRVSEAAS